MGLRDRLNNIFGGRGRREPDQERPNLWNRVTDWARRRRREPPEPDIAIGVGGGDGVDLGGSIFYAPTGEIGGVRIIIHGTFGSKSGGNIYSEWTGTIDTNNGNLPPSSANAITLADALTAQDPRAVVDAINRILTLDYAGQQRGGRGGFTSYGPTEGMRVIGISAIAITWS
ncbi:hypothetical protein [Mycobacteroides salmoniphilum]|uniref:Uncharacterized protein n=1 Tax=Mycobacteroides salmoniphilum TaxID=404941 RepID=A0A4V3I1L8_9MYCO|nr:hypothetical protein [Mycobacteroides salmoniphilum]TEA09204.1 hypothetical protein CCUG60884_00194 [Mycobacteroides salmoniphilum]